MIIRIQKQEQPSQSIQRDLIGEMVRDELCTRLLRVDPYCAVHARDYGRIVRVIGRLQISVTVDIELVIHVNRCHCDCFAYQISVYWKIGAEVNFENGCGHGHGEPVHFDMSIGE